MNVEQLSFENNTWQELGKNGTIDANKVQLTLCFGDRTLYEENSFYPYLKSKYPNSAIVFSSTAGQISGTSVHENNLVVTSVEFEKTNLKAISSNLSKHSNSYELGAFLFKELNAPDLQFVFVISDGGVVNGSELVKGMNSTNHKISITGGLAGDAARFEKTVVGLNSDPQQGEVVAIGFYGKNLVVGHSSMGGWDMFGLERTITKSNGNILQEIDGKNALDLYKEYLGEYANELPGAALLFPLSIKIPGTTEPLVRTILSVDEENKTMTFAGDIPEGSKARLMKANFDRVIEASAQAANTAFSSIKSLPASNTSLAILISCVGRKLVLADRIDEEIHAASEMFNTNTIVTGFYSYGEISPFNANSKCELHNQTMTITSLSEQ